MGSDPVPARTFWHMELQDRVVVITGGGSGIGEALAHAAHAAGARHVVCADLNGAEAERVAAEIGGTGVGIDVRDEAAIQQLVTDTEDAHGPIDLFFGHFIGRNAVEQEFSAIANFLDVDVCLVLDRSSSMKLSTSSTEGLEM